MRDAAFSFCRTQCLPGKAKRAGRGLLPAAPDGPQALQWAGGALTTRRPQEAVRAAWSPRRGVLTQTSDPFPPPVPAKEDPPSGSHQDTG